MIAVAGKYQDQVGRSYVVMQVYSKYTLVAGKQCLFRVFVSAKERASA